MCWSLWKARNSFYFDKIECLPTDIIARAERSWKEFNGVLSGSTDIHGLVLSSTESPPRWSPPPTAWVKLHVDAAVSENSNGHGLGFIIRDSVGVSLTAVSQKMSFPFVVVGEAMAIHEAFREAFTLGFTNIVVESDSCL
ncbi:hypothetical protein NE237_018653 [Protea cynaroides]|uniref:RNase H type-1 domain-containing protein n=1 Tax=Protea cynaroides TaxID=273540 RepID=A0A9Q0KAE1_9MAGN|nr:hypothetical protein NE237_018653 [Protea cynaroides]